MYLLDFGTNGLAPLSQLPHVADSLLLDQTEKIQKFIRIINRELDRRKKLLSEHGVGTIALYREVTGKQEPTMVILMDSYESMKDEPYETDLFKLFMRISREGLSIGVHLIITASRQNNLRAQLYSNFKHQLTLPQNDISEVRGIVGATPLASTMEDIKGRALMKRDEVDVVQFALPVAGDNDIQIINNLRDQVQSLKEMWTGRTPAGIPMVPDELTIQNFMSMPTTRKVIEDHRLPVGLELEEVETIGLPMKKLKHLMLLSDKDSSLSLVTKHMIRTVIETVSGHKVTILDPTDEYKTFVASVNNYVPSTSDFKSVIEQLQSQVQYARQNGGDFEHYIFITDMGQFVSESGVDTNDIAQLMEEGLKVGLHFVFSMHKNFISAYNDTAKYLKSQLDTALIAMKMSDQTIYTRTSIGREEALPEDQVYLHYQASQTKLKITK